MEKFRIPLLAIVFGTVFFFLGKAILFSPSERSSVVSSRFTPFVFPTNVPLSGWQLSSSSSPPAPLTLPPTADTETYSLRTLARKQYRYIQNNLPLDIHMTYVVNTSGKFNLKSTVKDYFSTKLPLNLPLPTLRHQEGIGFYNLVTVEQRAYLNACINSRGGSTITQLQFMLNRYVYDIRPDRIILWLLGEAPLRDRRCLWTHLSIPLKNTSSNNAYQILETAWFSWYQWWLPRFPKY